MFIILQQQQEQHEATRTLQHTLTNWQIKTTTFKSRPETCTPKTTNQHSNSTTHVPTLCLLLVYSVDET